MRSTIILLDFLAKISLVPIIRRFVMGLLLLGIIGLFTFGLEMHEGDVEDSYVAFGVMGGAFVALWIIGAIQNRPMNPPEPATCHPHRWLHRSLKPIFRKRGETDTGPPRQQLPEESY